MINKENFNNERIEKCAEILWIMGGKTEPFESILKQSYEQTYSSIITEKMIENGDWDDYSSGYAEVKSSLLDLFPIFHNNICEWICDEPLSVIRYRGYSLADIINIRDCDFYSAAKIMASFIRMGDLATDDFPYTCRLNPLIY